MATYSSAPATSIVLKSVKDIRANGNTSLFTVAANEEYELIKSFVIDQDGNSEVTLYAIYDDDIINHDVPDSGGEKGFYESIKLAGSLVTGPANTDYHNFTFDTQGIAASANDPTTQEDAVDQTGSIWNTDKLQHNPIKFYEGAEAKVFYTASDFVAPEECQIFMWFRKTVHNG